MHIPRNYLRASRALLLVAALTTSAELFAAAPSPATIAAAYQGSWKARFVGVQTPFSEASIKDELIANDCRAMAREAICAQSVDGKPSAELHYVPAGRPGAFVIQTIAKDGTRADAGNLFIAGKRWTYPWHEQHGGQDVAFRVVNLFAIPNRILFAKEYRLGNGPWRQAASGSELRVSEPAVPTPR